MIGGVGNLRLGDQERAFCKMTLSWDLDDMEPDMQIYREGAFQAERTSGAETFKLIQSLETKGDGKCLKSVLSEDERTLEKLTI